MVVGVSRLAWTVIWALVAAVLVGASLQHMQAGGEVRWIIYVSGSDNPVGRPTIIKVWAYDPELLETYNVTCNVTVTDGSDVVLMDRFSGDPAVYEFNSWRVDIYHVYLSCMADAGGGVASRKFEDDITYHYPSIDVRPESAPWGRPFDLRIVAEYRYNESLDVYIGGVRYRVRFSNGVAVVRNLVLYGDADVVVSFLGVNKTYRVAVGTPRIDVYVSRERVRVGERVALRAWFADDEGPVPASIPIEYIVTGCASYDEVHPANTTVTLTVGEAGVCEFTARAVVNGVVVSNSTRFRVLPPVVKGHRLVVERVTPWRYRVEAVVEVDTRMNGSLRVLVDGEAFSDTGVKTVWRVDRMVELGPGPHKVVMVFTGEHGIAVEEERGIIVPKYPYNITDVPDVITVPFGEDWRTRIPGRYEVYVAGFNNTDLVAYVYYPGDALHQSASKLVRVRIVYPRIVINRVGAGALLEVRDGAPGARVTVYRVEGGAREMLYQAVLATGYHIAFIPGLGAGRYLIVYSYNGRSIVFAGGAPERIDYVTVCTAGVPCAPVAPSEWIEAVYIGGLSYTPGAPIVLHEGEYLVRVVGRDGSVITYTLRVVAPRVTVYIYAERPNTVSIDAPEGVTVKLVLKSGRVVEAGRGTHALPEEVVGAYSDYFKVRVVAVHTLP